MNNSYERQHDLPSLLPDGYFSDFVALAKSNEFKAIYQTRSNIDSLRRKLRLAESIKKLADPKIYNAADHILYRRKLRNAIDGEERILESLKEYRNATTENEYQSEKEPEQEKQASGTTAVPRARRWVRTATRFGDSYQF